MLVPLGNVHSRGGGGAAPLLLLVRMPPAEARNPIRSFTRVQEREEGAEFRWSRDGEERRAAESSGDTLA